MSSVLAIATRIHLGKASTPPTQSKLNQSVTSFLTFCNQTQSSNSSRKVLASIAVDAEEKIKGYDLAQAILEAIEYAQLQQSSDQENTVQIEIVKVSPWGNFIPALNALVSWAAMATVEALSPFLLFISAETQLTPTAVENLCAHVDSDTLVVGARLQGHDHKASSGEISEKQLKKSGEGITVQLNGRTTPWNTAAVWNLRKLSLSGFPLIAEGLLPNEDGSPGAGGVEETSCIGILQSILPPDTANAKLVDLKDSGVVWNQTWDDEERRKWHEQKMNSKLTRAARHLELLGLSGTVIHL